MFGQKSPFTPSRENKYDKCDHHFADISKSRGGSVRNDIRNVPKQHSFRKVSSLPTTEYTAAFTAKDEIPEEKPLKSNRVTYDCMLNDRDAIDLSFSNKAQIRNKTSMSQDQHQRNNSKKSRDMGSRLGLIFSIEDMTTDSTSILKDSRHPSISTICGKQSILGHNAGKHFA